MRIVQYLIRFRLHEGGVARAVIDLAALLAARGHDLVLLTTDPTDLPEGWDGAAGRPRVATTRAAAGWPALSREGARRAGEAIDAADVVHLHGPWDPVVLQLANRARAVGRPYVVSLHGMLDAWTVRQKHFKKRLFLFAGGRRCLVSAGAVHCCAAAELDQSRRWFPRGRGVVIPLLFDRAGYEPGPPRAAGAPGHVLFLSRLHPIKRIEPMIDAVAALRARGRDVRLTIAGRGEEAYERRLQQRAREAGLADAATFAGFVDGAAKRALLAGADALVLPSRHENFGFALVEALACATPVVTTREVSIWPELEATGGAIIAEATADGLAEAIARILDGAIPEATAREARRRVLDWLDPERVAREYEDLYRRLAPDGP